MDKHNSNNVICPCVCYLPPENSSRHFDVNSFYDHLLADIYAYQNDGLIFVCGDFNGRCGSLEDFISGVDFLQERNVIDFKTNFYGELLIDFLVNTNMCMLNGRNFECNDYTSISVKGLAVVDYCLVSHDTLDRFSKFNVLRTSSIINNTGNLHNFASGSVPDHSILSWYIDIDNIVPVCERNDWEIEKDKFYLDSVPSLFMSDEQTLLVLSQTINRLEGGLQN